MKKINTWGIVQQDTLGKSELGLPPGTYVHDNRKDRLKVAETCENRNCFRYWIGKKIRSEVRSKRMKVGRMNQTKKLLKLEWINYTV